MKWIGIVFGTATAADWVIGFLRGNTVTWKDVQELLRAIPGDPWIWFVVLVSITLAALLLAVFHETRNIVQAKMDSHAEALQLLKSEHAGILDTNKLAHDTAIQEEQRAHQKTKEGLAVKRAEAAGLKRRLDANGPQLCIYHKREPGDKDRFYLRNTSADRNACWVRVTKLEGPDWELEMGSIQQLDALTFAPLPVVLIRKSNGERLEGQFKDYFLQTVRTVEDDEAAAFFQENIVVTFELKYRDPFGTCYTRTAQTTMSAHSIVMREWKDFEHGEIHIMQPGLLDESQALRSPESTPHAD